MACECSISRWRRPARASGVVRGWACKLVTPEAVDERLGRRKQRLDGVAAAVAHHVVGVLAGGKLDEAKRALGAEEGEGADGGADRGLLPRAVAVEAEDGVGIEPPHALELRLGDGGAVRSDGLGNAGAVEGDDVHIALDYDQALGRAGGGAGEVEVVERAALVEERRVGRVEIFGLALARGSGRRTR